MAVRVPIRYITVFGVTALVALAVGIVFYMGFGSAAKNTRLLMSEQAAGLISSMERDLALWLRPVAQQANWIAEHVAAQSQDVSNLENFDEFMLGALAATSQVAGIALVTTSGMSRRWTRDSASAISEDWSSRGDIVNWIQDGRRRSEASWIDPFFTDTIGKTVLLHDLPVRSADGKLLAMLGQIVPIEELSEHVAKLAPRPGMTPFILYGKERVLAHPLLVNEADNAGTEFRPLIALDQLDDKVLNQIWSPDEQELFFINDEADGETSFQSTGTFVEEYQRFYVYLYKFIDTYGPVPWITGVHLNTDVYGGEEGDRLMRALLGSVVVLLAALIGAVFLGRYITRPVSAIANAANLVEANKLSEVPLLSSSRMREVDDAARSFNKMVEDLRERTVIRQTLGQFVPEEIARTLLSSGGRLQSKSAFATLMYSDIEGFTQLTESLGAEKTVEVLNAYFSAMVEIVEQHHGVVTQFHGDAVLATFNIPIDNQLHAQSAIKAAAEMLKTLETRQFAGHRLRARIGIDTGHVVAGAVGAAGRLSYTVYGDCVNLAARLEQLNKVYGTQLLVSENTVISGQDVTGLYAIGETEIRGQSAKMKAYTIKL